MLTLERKEDEVIQITRNGESIDIIVTQIIGNKIKLSFDGPESFEVWRAEVEQD